MIYESMLTFDTSPFSVGSMERKRVRRLRLAVDRQQDGKAAKPDNKNVLTVIQGVEIDRLVVVA